ncbi:hypothetical protein PHMEG_0008898 [Phytophthora megakarya]|uniref:Uncharacterized protein n=1 Tax=Phytophthora megakarya TaxID=4795 RepID=A0A225WK17_9STRA|nr:hypothetical protein PHMEG_0008898 [Phytophthora megakarya]
MNFKGTMKWVSESQGIHHLAPRESICRMLAQVIHAGLLGETPWCRFVPDAFYSSAEGTLRLRQAKRYPTSPWHPLGRSFIKVQKQKQSTRETEALQATLPESSDDETQDPSYELSQADWTRQHEPRLLPRTTSRVKTPACLGEYKTGNKRDKGGDPKSHGAFAKSKSRVIPIPKSQAVSRSGGAS